VGANATRKIFEATEAQRLPDAVKREGGYAVALTRHAHNAYIQVWYELGGIGALLMIVAAGGVLHGISKLPKDAIPFAQTQFAVTLAVLSSSYGMWQMWFLASIALGASILLVAAHYNRIVDPVPIAPSAKPAGTVTTTTSGSASPGLGVASNSP
jgi:O-antigen ligase